VDHEQHDAWTNFPQSDVTLLLVMDVVPPRKSKRILEDDLSCLEIDKVLSEIQPILSLVVLKSHGSSQLASF
jgi:hypothetical protein